MNLESRDYNQNVEGESKGSFEPEQTPEKEIEVTPELEVYEAEAQKLVDEYKSLFIRYAQDVSLNFKMSNAFYIDLENGVVNLDTKWFKEKGFSSEQILWAVLHELSHFRDLAMDPEGMMKNFEYMETQAKQTGQLIFQKWKEKYGESDPEFIDKLSTQAPYSKKHPHKTMSQVERSAYKIHHRFYNVFDDIYVNNLVAYKAPRFEKSAGGGKVVTQLYKEKLFPKTDYTGSPRHLQFLYKLLREEMVPDEAVTVSPEVEQALHSKIIFLGKEYTAKELIETFIKPVRGRDTKSGQRNMMIRMTLEPIFMKLLIQDLADWDPEKKKPKEESVEKAQEKGEGGDDQENENEDSGQNGEDESNGGDGDPFQNEGDDFDSNNPDQISDEDIDDWLDKHKENKTEQAKEKARQKTEESKSDEQKAEEAREQKDKEWADKNKLDYEIIKKQRQIEREVEPYLDQLNRELWKKIIYGSGRTIERQVERFFSDGDEMDVSQLIEQWPKVETGEFDELKIFKKMREKEVLTRKPELIRVRLVGDMSGSMKKEKIHILQQSFMLLLSSLSEFQAQLGFSRSQTKSRLKVDSEAWVFGDKAKKVKRLDTEAGSHEAKLDHNRVLAYLQETLGDTYDHKPLKKIFHSLSAGDLEKIKEKKIMEMVFEITDGASSDSQKSRKAIDELLKQGVIVRGFQIGVTSESDKKIFNEVWNDKREKPLGHIVGKEIADLLPALVNALKEYLSDVKL